MINYRELLVKYINLVHEVNGGVSVEYLKHYSKDVVVLSDEEWSEIEKLTDEVRRRDEGSAIPFGDV